MSEGSLDLFGVEGGESEKMSERLLLVSTWAGDEGDGGVEGGVIAMEMLNSSCICNVEVEFEPGYAGMLEDH